MSLSNIFTSNLPKLDIHGETRDSAVVAINDFIKDNKSMKKDTFIIVHGKGLGILKKITQETLKRNRDVLEYQLDFYNIGSTIVKIKI